MEVQEKTNTMYEAHGDAVENPVGQIDEDNSIGAYEALPTEPDTGPDTELNAGETKEQAGESSESNESSEEEFRPHCSFYACFACEDGYCTALNNADFHGHPCPFFKAKKSAEKDRKDAFDRLLICGRLDIINRYEEILVNLGIENPKDAGEGPIVIDDDVLAARAELEKFKNELDEEYSDSGEFGESGESEDYGEFADAGDSEDTEGSAAADTEGGDDEYGFEEGREDDKEETFKAVNRSGENTEDTRAADSSSGTE